MSNLDAFLTTIAVSEGVAAFGDRGYNALVGSIPSQVLTFSSYADHPRTQIWLSKLAVRSDAAGRYQILARYYDAYRVQLDLKDFSPASQDAIATQMLREVGALPLIAAGQFDSAVQKARGHWASFPGNTAAQHQQTLAFLTDAYRQAGGIITA